MTGENLAIATFVSRLGDAVPAGTLAYDVPLATLGRWRIGGPADVVATPHDIEALRALLRAIRASGVHFAIIGDGSNLLFDDAGFRGVIVRIGRAFADVEIDGDEVAAGAGLWVPAFVRRVIAAGLAGVTHAIGIPGTLGGLLTMNGGSQRRGIGDHVISVDVLDPDGDVRRLEQNALDFSYRGSALQCSGQIVLSARFRFARSDPSTLRREAIAILRARRAKFPRVRANCGSVFVSDPALYAQLGPPGLAIERAGLKGRAIGDAQIAPEHANFIVNRGHARSRDVLGLIALARRQVWDQTGIAMTAEVRYLASDGALRPAHEAASALLPDIALKEIGA